MDRGQRRAARTSASVLAMRAHMACRCCTKVRVAAAAESVLQPGSGVACTQPPGRGLRAHPCLQAAARAPVMHRSRRSRLALLRPRMCN